ncbi:DNA repair protein XRCC3-like [Mucor ambiguus]|uniref:DNA repair protein XRCC3-like n=1 Tax=Mucor ambiguus TaxID=91626 RepID=A0A0C9MQH5_9FUNG|nr:DNA repair protein XRCC3-like [Mucor ambiguus]
MDTKLKETLQQFGLLDKIEELGLDSAADILSKSSADLQRLLRINSLQASLILRNASRDVYDWRKRVKTGDELLQQDAQILTTGDAIMDQVLHGGISLGMITEIVGESSSGKTQLALQLALTAQKPKSEGGLEGAAVYIHSEGPFPSNRLDQLVSQYPASKQQQLKNSIHTIRIRTSEEQYQVLAYQLPAFLERHPNIKVILIDSISAIYRSEPASERNKFDKMSEICELGSRLKKLADQYRVAIVAVNQVSDVFEKEKNGNRDYIDSWLDFKLVNADESNQMIGMFIQSLLKKPILGLAWSNSVNTRIRLARSPMLERIQTRRVLFIEFSPIASRLGCELTIDDSGIHAVTS